MINDHFTAPYFISKVYPQGEDQPPIFVLKDGNGLAVGGFQDHACGLAVAEALNEHAAFVNAMKADKKLMERYVTVAGREARSAPSDGP